MTSEKSKQTMFDRFLVGYKQDNLITGEGTRGDTLLSVFDPTNADCLSANETPDGFQIYVFAKFWGDREDNNCTLFHVIFDRMSKKWISLTEF